MSAQGRSEASASRSGEISFEFNLGKIEDQGEDSDPILQVGPDLGLLAVFDGMGGAGGTSYEVPGGHHTGAYLASRLAREVVRGKMLQLLSPSWYLQGETAAAELHDALASALSDKLDELKAPASGLRSRLVRSLPTTMALLALQRRDSGSSTFDAHVFWAGDSRAYLLDPHDGAQQLTTDDIKSGADAMRNLTDDSVMSNCISASADFHINHRAVELEAPFVVLCATDGCFGYLPSPMHFEQLLLSTMLTAKDMEGWKASLIGRISEVTGDDASMALVGVGGDLAAFQDVFTARAAEVERRYVAPLDQLRSRLAQAEHDLKEIQSHQVELGSSLWEKYRSGYEHFLATGGAVKEES